MEGAETGMARDEDGAAVNDIVMAPLIPCLRSLGDVWVGRLS